MGVIYKENQMSFSNLQQFSQNLPNVNLSLDLQAALFNEKETNRGLLSQKTNRGELEANSDQEIREKTQAPLNNGRWNNTEHKAFIEGIFKYSNDWKRITDGVKTRNCPQARSHSQKFFSKLNKYITKTNANYYVDLKKIFLFGKQVESKIKENVVEMLFLAHDHLDNVLNCELLNHNLLRDFLGNVKKNKPSKDEEVKNENNIDNNENHQSNNNNNNNNNYPNFSKHQNYNFPSSNQNNQRGNNTNKIINDEYINYNNDCGNFSGSKVYNNINININVTNVGSAFENKNNNNNNNKSAFTVRQQTEMNQNHNYDFNSSNFDTRNKLEIEKNRNINSNRTIIIRNKEEIYSESEIQPKNNSNYNRIGNGGNQNLNTKGNYERECPININNLNLTTLKDNSTEEVKTRSSNRKQKGKKEEQTAINEQNTNYDLIIPQPIKNNFSNFIQLNSDFAKTFSQEIEKDNFFRMQGLEVRKNFTSKENIFTYGNSFEQKIYQRESDSDKQTDNSIGKISSYDYNNFYFNRCLEYLKKNSYKGKTDLIQEIKKCFIFPKKLLIENNNCNCFKCRSENSEKNADLMVEEYENDNKKCINNQFYYCEFDDISFISNHEKHCYMNMKKDSNTDME